MEVFVKLGVTYQTGGYMANWGYIIESATINVCSTVPSGEADWLTITQELISWLRSTEVGLVDLNHEGGC